jgi:mRNA interferase MazF
MALMYYPRPGEIVLCNYGGNVIHPEMDKRRPVVIVTPRLRRRGQLVGVIPLSTTAPNPIEDYHCSIVLQNTLPAPFDSQQMWAKCDMLATVSIDRLDRFRGSGRTYTTGMLNPSQLKDVQTAVLCGLGLSSLTIHL